MLNLVIKKEILDNLLNMRFLVASAISLALVLSSIVVLTKTYEDTLQDYQNRVMTQDDFIDHFGHLNRAGWMSRQTRMPSHFQVLVLGIDREAQEENFVSNPIPALLSRLDYVSIVTIIMSLMAILFSYNALSAEREAGLLKQMLSTGLPRRTLMFGKFIGGNISILVPFTVGVLAGLLYLVADPNLSFQTADLFVFLALMFVSWLYIAAFYGLGLLFSSRSAASSQAIVKSLFGWVILILIIPNISPFLAAQLYPVQSAAKLQQEIYGITDRERDQNVNTRGRELLKTQFPDLVTITGMSQVDLQAKVKSDPAFKARYALYAQAYDEMVKQVNKEQQEQADKLSETFMQRSKQQEELARVITSASPFSNFVFVATDMTETGIAGDNDWHEQVERYGSTFWKYAETKYQKEKQRNPAFDSNDYLDMRDRPRFQYQPSGFSERIVSVLPQVGMLVIFNLIFLAGAFGSFLKYDVR